MASSSLDGHCALFYGTGRGALWTREGERRRNGGRKEKGKEGKKREKKVGLWRREKIPVIYCCDSDPTAGQRLNRWCEFPSVGAKMHRHF